ncbi:hypothetical protein MB02_04270 [Croceicoccus estronivorus]|nr:hypothetical protein MB02_04270 [Croceicoccus estronivorus]
MLIMLTLIYSLNYLDRQIVLILQEPIKEEFVLQDWQLGLLTGGSISLFYTLMGIPIARWVDTGINRVRMIAVITILWSLLTAVGGVTRNYAQLFVARMGVGMAESGYTPAAHSLLSDIYPADRRPAAMGIFATGIPIGMMLGLAVGGYIAQHYSWRAALLIVGLPGVIVALAFLLIAREPMRGESESTPQPDNVGKVSFRDAVSALWHRPAYVQVVLASAGASFVQMGIAAWLPSYLIRVHGMSLSEVGLGMAVLTGSAGLFGTWFGGWLASRLGARGMHAMLWAPIIGLTLSIPLHILAFSATSGMTTLWLLLPPMILVAFWTAPSIAVTQSLAPVATRATASAVYVVGCNVIGVAMGPIFAGILSDMFNSMTGDPARGLQLSLICLSLLMLWSVTHWIIAARHLLRQEQAAA